MSIYYEYTPDGSKIVVLSYVDDCVYWYTNEDIGKYYVDTLEKIFCVKFLGYAHWFMSVRISHGISFLNYPQTIFQSLRLYTNIHSHQNKMYLPVINKLIS